MPDNATEIILDPHVTLAIAVLVVAVLVCFVLMALINGPARRRPPPPSGNWPRFPPF